MKKHLIFVLCISFILQLNAQSLNWKFAKPIRASVYLSSNLISSSSNDCFFMTERYYDTLKIDTLTITKEATFLAKIDTSGLVKKIILLSVDESKYIFRDNSSNVYIIGYFSFDSLDFGNGIKLYKSPSVLNGQETFIAKFDSDLNVKWAKKSIDFASHANNGSQGLAVAADVFGNTYLSGNFDCDSVQFGSTILRAGNDNFFLVKYDSTGNIRWVKQTMYRIDKLATDSKGNVYAGCVIGGFDTLQTNPLVIINGALNNLFILKMDTAGILKWATASGSYSFFDEWKGLTCVNDKIYFTGQFGGNYIKLGNDSIYSPTYAPFYTGRIDTTGNILWGRGAFGSQTFFDATSGIAADAMGRVYITGSYQSTQLQFDASHTIQNNSGHSNLFVASYDSLGNVLWIKGSDASNQNDGADNISCSMDCRSVYVVGGFSGGAETFGHTTLPLLSGNNYFIAKLSLDSCVVIPPMVNYSRLSFCQGDTLHLGYTGTGNHAIWSNGVAGNSIVVKDSLKAWVTVTQANGCTVSSNHVQAAVHPLPDTVLTVTPWNKPHDICKGNSIQLSVPVGNHYLWTTGATTNGIYVDTTGNYKVVITTPFGCKDSSYNYSMLWHNLPPNLDSVVFIGDTLYAYPASITNRYEWCSPAPSFPYNTTTENKSWAFNLQDGKTYYVVEINQYGCVSANFVSVVYHQKNIGISSITNEGGMVLYPNPCSQSLVISQPSLVKTIEVTNVLGQKMIVNSTVLDTYDLRLDTYDLVSGIYFIKAIDVNGKVSNGKFVKE